MIWTVRMPSKNRNITLECSVCKKKMKSDNLERYLLAKHNSFDLKVTTVVRGFLKDKDGVPSSSDDLESKIVANGQLLDEMIALVEKISKVLTETNTKEESLSKKHMEAFDLYQSRKLAVNPHDDIKLYPWQQQAMNRIQKTNPLRSYLGERCTWQ